MDMFDCFLPSSDYFPVDLEDIEPLLPSNSMQIQDLFPSTDFYNFRFNESSSNNALINLGFDEPMSSSQNSPDLRMQQNIDAVFSDHNYAALPQEDFCPSSCLIGVESEDESLEDTMLAPTLTNSSPSSLSDNSETSATNFLFTNSNSFNSPNFHSSSISELAKKQVKAKLPNFRPIVLTEEEKALLVEEGTTIRTDLPLTKSEEKVLKRVRRKIRNKRSAKVSRQKKKSYIEGLESQVSESNGMNQELSHRITELEQQNASLKSQLSHLMTFVTFPNHKTTQATSCLLVLLLAIGLFIAPSFSPGESNTSYQAPSGHRTRKVLEYKDEQQQQQQQHTYLSHAYLSQTFFSLLKAYAFNNQTENKSVTAEEKEKEQPPFKNSTELIASKSAASTTPESAVVSTLPEEVSFKENQLINTRFIPITDETSILTIE